MELKIIKNGYLQCDKGFITLGKDMGTKIKIPVFCFLVKHPKGNILIDSGICKNYKKEWGKRLGYFKPSVEKDIVKYLKGTPISYVINTHLHIDHCGNNHEFKNAVFIVQKDEYNAALSPAPYQKLSYPDKIDKELNYRLIEGNLDLFDDGSIKIIKTAGHTQGHQSIILRINNKSLMITGDACYTRENLSHNILHGILWNPDKIMEAYKLIRGEEEKGAAIIFGHEE